MSTLQGTTIADKYKGLIRVDGDVGVPHNEIRNFEDGDGNVLPIGIQRQRPTDSPNTVATDVNGAKIYIGENGGNWVVDNGIEGNDQGIRTSMISMSGFDIDMTGRGTLNIAGADVSISANGETGEVDITGAIVLSGDGEIDFYESFVPGDSDAYDIGTVDSVIQTVYVSNSGLGFRDADVSDADLQVNHNNKLTYKTAGLTSHVNCQDQVAVNSYEELDDPGSTSTAGVQMGEHATTLVNVALSPDQGGYILPDGDSNNTLQGSRKVVCIKEGVSTNTSSDLVIKGTFANTHDTYTIAGSDRAANKVHVIELVNIEGGWIVISSTDAGTYSG